MKMSFTVKTPNLLIPKKDMIKKYKRVLFLSMNKMEILARRKVAVDTGLLKASIKISPMREGATTYVISDGVHYGIHVEYGTSRQKAQPFFRPAYHEVKYIWLDKYKKKVFGK